MAQARLEKFGSIYTRITSLLRGGAMQEVDKPIWYKIYEAFPPKYEPRYDRTVPKIPIKEIFYKEDIIRARFHKDCKKLEAIDLLRDKNYLSQTRMFLDEYYNLQKSDVPESEAYEQVLLKHIRRLQDLNQDQKKTTMKQKV